MTKLPTSRDRYRSTIALKARNVLADVEANEAALRLRQDELKTHVIAAPAANWRKAAGKAHYLLNLFAATPSAQDPRCAPAKVPTSRAPRISDFVKASPGARPNRAKPMRWLATRRDGKTT
jgi:hypothetical protein